MLIHSDPAKISCYSKNETRQNVNPREDKRRATRLEVLMGVRELLISSFLLFLANVILTVRFFQFPETTLSAADRIINRVICLILSAILVWNGIIRLICSFHPVECPRSIGLDFCMVGSPCEYLSHLALLPCGSQRVSIQHGKKGIERSQERE